MIERIGQRPVAPDKAADLPREQGCKTDQKQGAGEFTGGDGANQQSGYRNRDQHQQTNRGDVDARPKTAGAGASGLYSKTFVFSSRRWATSILDLIPTSGRA